MIFSLNVGLPKEEDFPAGKVRTALCKRPVFHPVALSKTGLEGDEVADHEHHGGADKAVCAYSLDHYPAWEKLMVRELPRAAFGENLTILNLTEKDVCIGDVFALGTALIQVSQPRQPCRKLADRYGRPDLVRLMAETGQIGWYFRVLQEGLVAAGDPLILSRRDEHLISVAFANRIVHDDPTNGEGLAQVLAVSALSDAWRQDFETLRRKHSTSRQA